MMYFSRSSIIVAVTSIGLFSTVFAQDSTDRAVISSHPLISQRVKNIVDSNEKLWNKRNILYIQNNITLLHQDLLQDYKGEMVITDNPQTKQEQISQAMDVLARYLCLHRQTVLDNFPQKKYYTPRIAIKDQSVEMNQGACYRNNTLLRQEGIRYYTLPGVGTLQTAPLSLLRDLGYVTNNLEQYIVSEDITLTSSDSFFLESFSNKEIIPILDLTHTEGAKVWKRKFDTVKIVAYLESSQYPFVDGAVMLAVFALKGDNVIKITIPYGEIQHDLLANVMAIVKEMFVASIDMEVRDEVLTAKYFDAVYADALAHLSLTDTKLLKNIVHYYLSALWQYDESPEEFAKMIPSLIDKDLMLQIKLQSVLADLEAFLYYKGGAFLF